MCVFVRFMHFRHNLLPSSLSQSYQILAILMKKLAIVDLEFLWRFTQSVTKCYQQKSWIMQESQMILELCTTFWQIQRQKWQSITIDSLQAWSKL